MVIYNVRWRHYFINQRRIVILIVYVDDIILSRDHMEEISKLKSLRAKEFEIKEFGILGIFLEWK